MMARVHGWIYGLLLGISALMSLAIAADTLWGREGWPRRLMLHQEVQTILHENAALTATLATLNREIAAQSERPEVQEALVRDLLGYVRPNDIIVRLDIKP